MSKNKKKHPSKPRRVPADPVKAKRPISWGALIAAVAIAVALGSGLIWYMGREKTPATAPQGRAPAPQGGSAAATTPATPKKWSEAPAMALDPTKKYQAVVTTEEGAFTIDLWADKAPITVNNFVFLARQHYYDGVPFHRIIQNFMVQTGDPTASGMGSPGYRIQDELPPPGSYDVGVVAMANAGANTGGSQFFICTGPTCKNLDSKPNFPQFGKISTGMDVVQKIAATPVKANGEGSTPVTMPHMLKVEILEK